MKITNRLGIDDALVAAMESPDWYGTPDADITVTALVRPPQIAYLEQIHQDKLTEDASEGLWRLLGQAVHEVLAKAHVDDGFQEERLYADIAGWRVTGRPDLYRDRHITDFKVTSVWSFVFADKPDWEAQLNYYAVLYRRHGFAVDRLSTVGICRDWQRNRAEPSDDYPRSPFGQLFFPVWPADEAEQRIERVVREHQAARAGCFRPCTDAERWAKPDRYATMRQGQKRAVKLHADLDSATRLAEEMIAKGIGATVEHRPGDPAVRCRDYCSVLQWCQQAKEERWQ